MARGIWPIRKPCMLRSCLFPRSRFSFVVRTVLAQTSRTAVYGPVRTVVWQGAAGEPPPPSPQLIFGLRRGLIKKNFPLCFISRRPPAPFKKKRFFGHFFCIFFGNHDVFTT